jgi:hypothetical protein
MQTKGLGQYLKYLPSMCDALSSIPIITRKKTGWAYMCESISGSLFWSTDVDVYFSESKFLL